MHRCDMPAGPRTAIALPANAAQPAWLGQLSLAAAACLCAAPAAAQDAVAGRGLSYSARVDALMTSSTEERTSGRSSDLVAELRPSFLLNGRSGRVVGHLNYALSLTHRRRDFDGQNVHNQLDAALSGELIERWAYLDVAARVGQQALSAYGQQSAPGSTRDNANQVEVGSLSLSPYVRGVAGSAVSYELRLTASGTNGRRSVVADSTSTGASLALSSAFAGSLLGWGFNASHVRQDFRAGRESRSDRYSGSLSYFPDPDLSLSLRAGQESNDVASLARTTYDNWGAGFTWRPSPRTRAQVQLDQRYFGKSHQVLLDHRMATVSFQFTSSRDASNGADPGTTGQSITLYQALDRLLVAQYPDPVDRDAQIRLLLGNADPNQRVGGGSITSAVVLNRRNQLSAAYGAARVSASVQAFTARSESTDPAISTAATRQWGCIGTLSYRMTPTASVALAGSRLLTQGTDVQPGSQLKSASVSWADQIARRTTAAVSLRYSVFNSPIDPYREAAIVASLGQRF